MTRSGFRVPANGAALALCAALMLGCGDAREPTESAEPGPTGPDPLMGLVDVERAFGRAAETDGVGDAFQSFVAEDGILFRPGPVEAGPWLRSNAPGPSSLRWVPVAAGLASSGDLGYTTGPYVATDDTGSERHGQYLSIWQIKVGEGFKVVLDIGTPTPPAGPLPAATEVAAEPDSSARGDTPGLPASAESLESLLEVDRAFAVEQATKGTGPALSLYAAPSIRIHRAGSFPMVGVSREELEGWLAAERPTTSPLNGRTSESGTLGYAYGSVAGRDGNPAGNYVRIWRRDPGGPWALAVDVIDVDLSAPAGG